MSSNDNKNINNSTDRRGFLKMASAISLGSLGLGYCSTKENDLEQKPMTKQPATGSEEPGASRIISYRRLGRTGLRVSDISFGAGGLTNYRVALRAIQLGINYFDTAPDYVGGRSEKVLGQAIKASGVPRSRLVIATKFCYETGYPGHMYNESKETYMKAVNDCLKRLQTNYIDFVFVHALGEKDSGSPETYRLKDQNMLAAFRELKSQGKVRHLAVSCHNYTAAMKGGIDYAINSGNFDLIMLAYNFRGGSPDKQTLESVVNMSKKAYRKGVAFVAMKTLNGARGLDSEELKGKGTFAQAAFKWVLSNPAVGCLVVTMRNMSQIEEYVKASGQKFTYNDYQLLKQASLESKECQIGCTDCEKNCPKGVKIADILRYNIYFNYYDQEKYAMQKYSFLPASMRANNCDGCESPCQSSCAYGVNIKEQLAEAHANLSFA